jgi:hypothetical protein
MKTNWKTIVAAAGIAALSVTGVVGCGGGDQAAEQGGDNAAAGEASAGGDTGGDTGGEGSTEGE